MGGLSAGAAWSSLGRGGCLVVVVVVVVGQLEAVVGQLGVVVGLLVPTEEGLTALGADERARISEILFVELIELAAVIMCDKNGSALDSSTRCSIPDFSGVRVVFRGVDDLGVGEGGVRFLVVLDFEDLWPDCTLKVDVFGMVVSRIKLALYVL